MITIALALFLAGSPCRGDTPPDATVGPIVYQGPTIADATVGPIIYQGPTLSDATVGPIIYQGPTIADVTVGPINYSSITIGMQVTPKQLVPEARTIKPVGGKPVLKKMNTVPVIVAPTENQHMAPAGTLLLKARLPGEEADLVWEVEYKPFGTQRFTAGQQQPIASPSAGGGDMYSGKLKLDQPGEYRLRVKANAPGALWSLWRTVLVGKAPAAGPAQKTILKNTTETEKLAPGVGADRGATKLNN
jgi:hypothetical protein